MGLEGMGTRQPGSQATEEQGSHSLHTQVPNSGLHMQTLNQRQNVRRVILQEIQSKDGEFRAISVLANSVLGSILWILLFSFPKIGLFGSKVSDWLLTDLLTG